MADTEINLAQLKEYKAGEYQLIDIRNEDAFRYGSIKGAVNLPEQETVHSHNTVDRGADVMTHTV